MNFHIIKLVRENTFFKRIIGELLNRLSDPTSGTLESTLDSKYKELISLLFQDFEFICQILVVSIMFFTI